MENSEIQALVSDLIHFLHKWGLWKDTIILANGNKYSYSSDKTCEYEGIKGVEFEENVEPENYTTGIIDCDGNYIRRSFSNPEHILDIVYEGPLYSLLVYNTYETQKSEISKEAWEYIFSHSDILDELLDEKYDCCDDLEFLQQILEGKSSNYDYPTWNPLVFDTWEEYQEFVNGEAYKTEEEKLTPTYPRYGSHKEYLADIGMSESLSVEDIKLLWEQMVRETKMEYVSDGSDISIPEIAGDIISEFNKIFERYGVWYNFGFRWSLTCYKK